MKLHRLPLFLACCLIFTLAACNLVYTKLLTKMKLNCKRKKPRQKRPNEHLLARSKAHSIARL